MVLLPGQNFGLSDEMDGLLYFTYGGNKTETIFLRDFCSLCFYKCWTACTDLACSGNHLSGDAQLGNQ